MINPKKLMTLMLAAALCVPLCACPSRPAQEPTATTRKTVNRNVPDFVSELKQGLKSIGELPENVGQNDQNKKHKLKYSYIVFVIDADGKFMRFSVLAKNSVNAKFDVYWKALYKECFGKDYKLDTEGFDPGKNVTRRIYGVSQDKM